MSPFWLSIRSYLINFFRGQAIRLALKKILGSAAVGGFKAMVIKWIVTHFYDEFAVPLIKAAFRAKGLVFDIVDGHILIKKMKKAEDDNDQVVYDSTVDDIMS